MDQTPQSQPIQSSDAESPAIPDGPVEHGAFSDGRLVIHQLQLGAYENFVYILADRVTKEAVAVDPAWDIPAIQATLGEHGYILTAIWLTHGHGDHTAGLADLVEATGVPVYISAHMPVAWRPQVARLVEFDEGDTLMVGALAFAVIATPGHSPDGTCFLHGNHLIAGDTLFVDGCGRCDLPDSDVDAMYVSLHEKLMALPDNTIIYPGHDYGARTRDTLAQQKQTNRFLRAKDHADFVRTRMGK